MAADFDDIDGWLLLLVSVCDSGALLLVVKAKLLLMVGLLIVVIGGDVVTG